jgi:hypothetical protein
MHKIVLAWQGLLQHNPVIHTRTGHLSHIVGHFTLIQQAVPPPPRIRILTGAIMQVLLEAVHGTASPCSVLR